MTNVFKRRRVGVGVGVGVGVDNASDEMAPGENVARLNFVEVDEFCRPVAFRPRLFPFVRICRPLGTFKSVRTCDRGVRIRIFWAARPIGQSRKLSDNFFDRHSRLIVVVVDVVDDVIVDVLHLPSFAARRLHLLLSQAQDRNSDFLI